MNPEKLVRQSDLTPDLDQAVRGGADSWEAHMSYESLLRRPNRTKRNEFKVEKFRDEQ